MAALPFSDWPGRMVSPSSTSVFLPLPPATPRFTKASRTMASSLSVSVKESGLAAALGAAGACSGGVVLVGSACWLALPFDVWFLMIVRMYAGLLLAVLMPLPFLLCQFSRRMASMEATPIPLPSSMMALASPMVIFSSYERQSTSCPIAQVLPVLELTNNKALLVGVPTRHPEAVSTFSGFIFDTRPFSSMVSLLVGVPTRTSAPCLPACLYRERVLQTLS